MKLTTLLFFCTVSLLAQSNIDEDNTYIKNRRGQLFFKGEIEHRVTPIYQSNSPDFSDFRGKLDKGLQNSGTGLNYSLNYFITKNFPVSITLKLASNIL